MQYIVPIDFTPEIKHLGPSLFDESRKGSMRQYYLVARPADDHVDDGGDEDAGHGEGGDELPAEEPVRVRPRARHQLDVVRKPE